MSRRDFETFDPAELTELVAGEITRLHDFFVDWFSGAVDADDARFDDAFGSRVHSDALVVPPSGKQLRVLQVAEGIRSAHGNNPEFRIAIRNVEVRHRSSELVLATYEEWQRNARASTPPDNGRLSTVLFDAHPERPGDLRWLHLHETWLPADVMADGPFDF